MLPSSAVLTLVLSLTSTSEAVKILILPGNLNSHMLYCYRLGEGLAALGHTVHVVVPSNDKVHSQFTSRNITTRVYDVLEDVPFASSQETSETLMKVALADSYLTNVWLTYSFIWKMLTEWEKDCIQLLENEKVMREIRDGGFDFAIMDPIAANCYYVVPYSFDIPFATLSIPFATWFFAIPRLPSFASSLGGTDELTFSQRLSSFLTDTLKLTLLTSSTRYSEKYVPDKPPLTAFELLQRSSLWFLMEDLAIGYPMPLMPNMLSLGDIMAQPPKSLPSDLRNFLEESPEGVLIVSFGSLFDYVPQFVATQFCEAFRRINFRIVWKLKHPELCPDANNVKALPWIPQNDLLAHKNSRLLITHGGLNSLIETIYHAKPAIVFPIANDQPGNANAAVNRGLAIQMKLSDFSSEELESNIPRP